MSKVDWSFYEVFPAHFMRILVVISKAVSVPVEVPMLGLLSMTSACIGKTRGFEIKPGYMMVANLYFQLVARSGTGKSPAVEPFGRAISAVEDDLRLDLTVTDFTIAGLRDFMMESDRGLYLCLDEGCSIFDLVSKDPKYLVKMIEAYGGKKWTFLKYGEPSIKIKRPCMTIMGTTQPDVLSNYFSGYNLKNGFLTRFLFVSSPIPACPSEWSWAGIDENIDRTLYDFVEQLLSLQLTDKGEPVILYPSEEAKVIFEEWVNADQHSVSLVDADYRIGLVGKLREQSMKLAILLHYMEQFESGGNSLIVSGDTMMAAIFLCEYFLAEHETIWLGATGITSKPDTNRLELLQAVLQVREKNNDCKISSRDVAAVFNEGKPKHSQLSDKAVGKALHGLGGYKFKSTRLPQNRGRGVVIDESDIYRIKLELSKVTNVFGI